MPSNPKNTRKCCVCKEHADKSQLVRITRVNDEIVVDEECKLNGRGVYVHKNAECIKKAIQKKCLNSAFRCAVPTAVYDKLNQL